MPSSFVTYDRELVLCERSAHIRDWELRQFDGALCKGLPPAWFFPEQRQSAGQARAICHECPCQLECLSWALAHPGLRGIWGGTTERERQRIRAA